METAYTLADLSATDQNIVRYVEPFTMTGLERRASLVAAVDHLVKHKIPGNIAECGVWRGGSMMTIALALIARGDTTRHLYLYDTYEGMSEPTVNDKSFNGQDATMLLNNTPQGEGVWCEASIEDVQQNLWSTGYPKDQIHFVKGKVEETISQNLPVNWPHSLALLRLDTDWYESTKHELQQLYPMLAPHGVLIIDDYGHWQGARQAVDEYFADAGPSLYLHRIDYTARLHVKPGSNSGNAT
jgi:O-methyltransferase